MALAIMAVGCLPLASCSDDNSEEENGQKADVEITGATGLQYEALSDAEISQLQQYRRYACPCDPRRQ